MNPFETKTSAARIGTDELSQHAAEAVQRALAARQSIAEMSPEEVAQVGGGAVSLATIRIWAGGPFILPGMLGGLGGATLPGSTTIPTVRF